MVPHYVKGLTLTRKNELLRLECHVASRDAYCNIYLIIN